MTISLLPAVALVALQRETTSTAGDVKVVAQQRNAHQNSRQDIRELSLASDSANENLSSKSLKTVIPCAMLQGKIVSVCMLLR